MVSRVSKVKVDTLKNYNVVVCCICSSDNRCLFLFKMAFQLLEQSWCTWTKAKFIHWEYGSSFLDERTLWDAYNQVVQVLLYLNWTEIVLNNILIWFVNCFIQRQFPDLPYIGFYKTLFPAIMLRDPELVRTVMVKDFAYFNVNDISFDEEIDPLLKRNAFLLKDENWKDVRAVTSSLFTSSKVRFQRHLTFSYFIEILWISYSWRPCSHWWLQQVKNSITTFPRLTQLWILT